MLGQALAIESPMPRSVARDDARGFVREHHGFVTRVLWSRGVPRGALDDAVQQVFMVSLPQLGSIRVARSFLYGVCVRVALEQLRSARRHVLPADGDTEQRQVSPEPQPDELLSAKQRRAQLDDVLAGMPEDVRTAFVLFELEDLTMREIAEVTGTAPGTVASRLRRGRELFQAAATRLRARAAREETP